MVSTRFSLLAVSAAALVSAQGPPASQDLSSGCTSKSFSVPSWVIEGISGGGTEGAGFTITNRATNFTTDVKCSAAGDCTTGTAGNLTASIKVNGEKVQFLVNQTWTCSDRSLPLIFTAIGNNSATWNYTSPLLIRGSLLAPLAITPTYFDGPTGHDSPGCKATSEKPSWKLSTVVFTDQTGDGTTSQPFQMFNVLLVNPANGYEASCMPGTSFEQAPDLSTLVCAGTEFQSFTIGSFPITTTAGFDVKTFTFSVKQTWFCDDHDPAKPLSITATGSTILPLSCETSPVPDSPADNKTVCTVPDNKDVLVPGSLGPVTTLKPFVIEDPIPAADGCTLTSIFHPAWAFSQFSVTTLNTTNLATAAAGAKKELFFNIILQTDSRGFQYPIPIYQGEEVTGEKGWYKCVVGQDGENAAPLWPYKCEFRFEEESKELELRADWACVDFDAERPVLFSGVSKTKVDSPFTCEATYDGNTECVIDGAISWTAPISNVTWRSSP